MKTALPRFGSILAIWLALCLPANDVASSWGSRNDPAKILISASAGIDFPHLPPDRAFDKLSEMETLGVNEPSVPSYLRTFPIGTPGGDLIQVPDDGMTLQQAINNIEDGGTIVISDGTYSTPSGGYIMNETGKTFTIRAADGATVILDGGGTEEILRYQNSSKSGGGPVIFDGLIFKNGYSDTEGLAGGVSIYLAYATFLNSTFEDNVGEQPSTGGGGVNIVDSDVYFENCQWIDNSAENFGGGLAISVSSNVYIHNSQFLRNRTNLPSHSQWAAGGAIHLGNSSLRIANTRFEMNEAGYVGGAIYAIGEWQDPVSTPRSDVLISNSTFVENQAIPDGSVSIPSPSEGGAIHAENQTSIKVYSSRLVENRAMIGGAINSYRASVEIYGSVFLGNQATGTGVGNGFGGAIAAHSNDTVVDGGNNRPSANLVVEDTILQGAYSSVTTVGQSGGGISIGGDTNRYYGMNGVSQSGTLEENQATADMQNVLFVELDVAEDAGSPGTGVGGAMITGLADVSINDALFLLSDANGTNNGSGGAIALLDQSLANFTNTSFSENTAGKYGGAIFAQGSTLNLSDCDLIENEVSPGVSETEYESFGAAIFTTIDEGRNHPVEGLVQNCAFSANVGLEIYDDDRTSGPINDVQYNGNQFYSTVFGSDIYRDSITGIADVSGLNALVVSRSNGTSTDKATVANSQLGGAPTLGRILVVPPKLFQTSPLGDPAPPTTSYIGYAWSGSSATLDGGGLAQNSGVVETGVTGLHTLSVDSTPFQMTLSSGAILDATLISSPLWIPFGDSSDLSWTISGGSFLEVWMDQGESISSSASGLVSVSPQVSTQYHIIGITDEGGASSLTWVVIGVPTSFTYLPVIMH